MKALQRYFLISITALAFASCMDYIILSPETMTIEYGTECGWCAGSEFIAVTDNKVVYTRTIPCGQNEGTVQITRTLSPERWQAITESFDYDQFRRLRQDACNVCADGCDEIIRITRDGKIHQIRYTPGSVFAATEELQALLHELMLEFRSAD